MFQLGIDQFLKDKSIRHPLKNRRIGFLGHPASQTSDGLHSLDQLFLCSDLKITSAFGPQHGMRGEKQDNMIESEDYLDPIHKIPVFSLYGKVRKPTSEMMDTFDILVVDLQDLGTRIYTFLTTLCYVIEACAQYKKEIWILDRPNPVGRPVEGSILTPGWESFVGIGPIPMRHGLTLAEAAKWFIDFKKLTVQMNIIKMQNYDLHNSPGHGWPLFSLSWINPSPNAANLSMARCYPGTVIIEGTHLSEGRGTTHPLECLGAPHIDGFAWIKEMQRIAPEWLKGAILRPCSFQPTFHKFSNQMCGGFQIHVDNHFYRHEEFQPYRMCILALKAIKNLYPHFELWRSFHYEYENERLAFDIINGGPFVREWIDSPSSQPEDLNQVFIRDEKNWKESRQPFLIYK